MNDEELRSQLAAWLRPLGQVPAPDRSVLSRRARRRRARQASAGALTIACITAAALVLWLPRAPQPGHEVAGKNTHDLCASRNLRFTWLPPAGVNGMRTYPEAPPETYLLSARNTGRSACVLDGWPRLTAPGPVRHLVYFFYRTHLDQWWKHEFRRFVRPTRVRLRPGATALSAVTISVPPAMLPPCTKLAWRVSPPAPGSAPVRVHGYPTLVCSSSLIEVSPLYPSSVPITSSYPPSRNSGALWGSGAFRRVRTLWGCGGYGADVVA